MKANDQLSRREQQVLQLVYNGLTNKEIAEKLNITLHTVKVHVLHIYEKTGCKRGKTELFVRRIKELENGIRRIYF